MKKKLYNKRYMIWYMLCFFAFGIIDQIRCSADGRIQMAAANCIGIVVAFLVIPSLKLERFQKKVYLIWTILSVTIGTLVGLWGWKNWTYGGQWITGVLNVVVWGYLLLYVICERDTLDILHRVKQPFFLCLMFMFFLMLVSRQKSVLPLWMLTIFGGYYLFGISENHRDDFFQGLLNGIILWFFVLQILAFGFRPYDYARYRGFYRGEAQNGIFYMMSYCAFLCKWILAGKMRAKLVVRSLYFVLSAASVSFLLFTGSRSSLLGVLAVTFLAYFCYYIIYRKKFWRFICRIVLLGVCTALLFPIVYGGIRYLPIILHHPIWFTGEYSESQSIRSFDPWDSERYISFEEAVDVNIGRILLLFEGNDHKELGGIEGRNLLVLKAYASASVPLEEDSAHPYGPLDLDTKNSIEIRKQIYKYYCSHLNFLGHRREEKGFYLLSNMYIPHAHNLFLQMAYDYGIPVGLLFFGIMVWCVIRLIRWGKREEGMNSWILLFFLSSIIIYGMTELTLNPGMMTWGMLYLCLCFSEAKGINRDKEISKNKGKKIE